MNSPSAERSTVISYLRNHLVGPLGGPDETMSTAPASYYTCGVLFPKSEGELEFNSWESSSDQEEFGDSSADESGDDPVRLSGQQLPSTMGISFFSRSSTVTSTISAGKYVSVNGSQWKREQLNDIQTANERTLKSDIFGGLAEIQYKWRKVRDSGWLVTVTLINTHTKEKPSPHNCSDICLFQVVLRCEAGEEGIGSYPSSDVIGRLSHEEEELDLLYRNAKPFAIGHGCGTSNSDISESSTVAWVQTETIPQVEVPPVVPTLADDQVLQVGRLSRFTAGTIAELSKFLDRYEFWIDKNDEQANNLESRYQPAANRLISRERHALSRMRLGVERLEADPICQDAFKFANESMLRQMFHTRGFAQRREVDDADRAMPTEDGYWNSNARWRPFQLAFFLLCIGTERENFADLATVDLIWFPTGGGKTEAYLAVAAFQVFKRRLSDPVKGGGTAVITRYTLRLLTAQQFQRTAALVCAMEVVRLREREKIGDQPFSLGLWIGKKGSPNTFTEAYEKFQDVLQEDRPKNPFQLLACPWCGTSIIPAQKSADMNSYGVRASNDNFALCCPNSHCEFSSSKTKLPINVVDEALYAAPPTFLIGTVDKFARLPWDKNAGVFFGSAHHEPPSLIIQDELHLLAGPLGTIVGAYEAAIESLCKMRSSTMTPPMIIASTATIRDSDNQSRALFGRRAEVFPPPGLISGDSFFAKEETGRPGRMYLGVLSPIHSKSTSLIRTCATLSQAAVELDLSEDVRDAYWTQVVYHNSLRELGQTTTFARDDIPAWIYHIAEDHDKVRSLNDANVLEVTSNVQSSEIPEALRRLEVDMKSENSVSLLACTNMFSVGVDVQRLGLMVVASQPKSTAEYIQATSRVGRAEDGSRPGLVICHYGTNKPRDRSHYEHFAGYHAALYKYVEPTSVSPTAVRARDRVLHAALTIMIRHGADLGGNDDAAQFNRNHPMVVDAIEILVERYSRADSFSEQALREHVDQLATEWEAAALSPLLKYQTSNKVRAQSQPLLKYFGEDGPGWPTLNSMRNVDDECDIKLNVGEM